jgi:hypothetical protein
MGANTLSEEIERTAGRINFLPPKPGQLLLANGTKYSPASSENQEKVSLELSHALLPVQDIDSIEFDELKAE